MVVAMVVGDGDDDAFQRRGERQADNAVPGDGDQDRGIPVAAEMKVKDRYIGHQPNRWFVERSRRSFTRALDEPAVKRRAAREQTQQDQEIARPKGTRPRISHSNSLSTSC